MAVAEFEIGERVSVYLDPKEWNTPGWVGGTVVRIDGYSAHRSFHWVELDAPAKRKEGGSMEMVAVLNPKHIQRA